MRFGSETTGREGEGGTMWESRSEEDGEGVGVDVVGKRLRHRRLNSVSVIVSVFP